MDTNDRSPSRRIVTVTFHGIGEPTRTLLAAEDHVWLPRDGFLRILDAIPRNGSVEITFDDGNRSDLEFAVPALLDRGLKASFFVLVGRIGEPGSLALADLRALSRNGMEIGSHGMWHHDWRKLTPRDAAEEIFEAKLRLENMLDCPISKVACPFGAYDRHALKLLRTAGFQVVYTSDGGGGSSDEWLRARNTIHKSDSPAVIGQIIAESFGAKRWLHRAKRLAKRLR